MSVLRVSLLVSKVDLDMAAVLSRSHPHPTPHPIPMLLGFRGVDREPSERVSEEGNSKSSKEGFSLASGEKKMFSLTLARMAGER